jgi:hypothetical protein
LQSPSSFRVPSFTGSDLFNKASREKQKFEAVMMGLFVPWNSLKLQLDELRDKLDLEQENCEGHITDISSHTARISFHDLFEHILPSLTPRVKFHIQNFQHLKKSSEDVKAERRFQNELNSQSKDQYIPDFDDLDDTSNLEQQQSESTSSSDGLEQSQIAIVETQAALDIIKNLTTFEMSGEKMLRHLSLQHRSDEDEDFEVSNHSIYPDLDVEQIQKSSVKNIPVPHFRRWVDSEDKAIAKARQSGDDEQSSEDQDTDLSIHDAGILDQDPVQLGLDLSSEQRVRQLGKEVVEELNLNQKQRLFLDLVISGITESNPSSGFEPSTSPSNGVMTHPDNRVQVTSRPLCIYLGGEGGTGKSVAIKAVERLMEKLSRRNWLQITATTGSAADNIGGSTYHSALKVNWNRSCATASAPQLAKWKDKRILIVDEVSMLSTSGLGGLELACRASKGTFCVCFVNATIFLPPI